MTSKELVLIKRTAVVTLALTLLITYVLTQNLRNEVIELRAEREAMAQNYCPYCGTYLGGE